MKEDNAIYTLLSLLLLSGSIILSCDVTWKSQLANRFQINSYSSFSVLDVNDKFCICSYSSFSSWKLCVSNSKPAPLFISKEPTSALMQALFCQITMELSRLQKLASNNKLTTEDITGGTITLSNIGAIGGKFGCPVLNLPEVAIIAVGRMRRLPRFGDDGSIYPASVTNVSCPTWC